MGSTSPGDPPDRPADTEQVEDDPVAFLERFAAVYRGRRAGPGRVGAGAGTRAGPADRAVTNLLIRREGDTAYRFARERQEQGHPEIEVVLPGAPSQDVLRTTHSRSFQSPEEQLRPCRRLAASSWCCWRGGWRGARR